LKNKHTKIQQHKYKMDWTKWIQVTQQNNRFK